MRRSLLRRRSTTPPRCACPAARARPSGARASMTSSPRSGSASAGAPSLADTSVEASAAASASACPSVRGGRVGGRAGRQGGGGGGGPGRQVGAAPAARRRPRGCGGPESAARTAWAAVERSGGTRGASGCPGRVGSHLTFPRPLDFSSRPRVAHQPGDPDVGRAHERPGLHHSASKGGAGTAFWLGRQARRHAGVCRAAGEGGAPRRGGRAHGWGPPIKNGPALPAGAPPAAAADGAGGGRQEHRE
jgi:hypothetical protein